MELKSFLEVCRVSKQASLILGPPGVGKSDEVKQYAEEVAVEHGRMFVEWNRVSFDEKRELLVNKDYLSKVFLFADVRLSSFDPTDLKGLPNFQGDTDTVVEWRPNSLFAILSQPECAGCLFLDELTMAPLSIQAPAYQLILDRCVGDVKISDDVFMTAAGNRSQDRTGAFDLGMALRNRFAHRTVEAPSIVKWTAWALDNNVNTDVIAYLNFQPQHLFDDLDKVFKSACNAYATPRSWVGAGRLLDAYKGLHKVRTTTMPYNEMQELVGSKVGEGHAITFRSFIELLRDIDLDDLIDNPNKLQEYMAQRKMDRVWAVIGAVPDWYSHNNTARDRDRLLNLTESLDVDFAVAMLRMLLLRFPEAKKQFLKSSNRKVLIPLAKYL